MWFKPSVTMHMLGKLQGWLCRLDIITYFELGIGEVERHSMNTRAHKEMQGDGETHHKPLHFSSNLPTIFQIKAVESNCHMPCF